MDVRIFIFAAIFVLGHAAPAKDDSSEVELLTPNSGAIEGPIVDTDANFPPSFNPFTGFADSFNSLFTRLRQQMNFLLNHLPTNNTSPLVPFDGIDLGKGNTTSVTKVIDGHKVTINETTYNQNKDNGEAFFKVRVINIEPESSEGASGEAKTEAGLETMDENEIPQGSEVHGYENLETFDEAPPPLQLHPQQQQQIPPFAPLSNELAYDVVDSTLPALNPSFQPMFEPIPSYEPDFGRLETMDSLPDERDAYDTHKESEEMVAENDLSGDVYVNRLMADAGATADPDAEVFDPVAVEKSLYYPR